MNDTITLTRKDLVGFLSRFLNEVKTSSRCCDRFEPGQGVNLETFVDQYWPKPDPKDCIYGDRGVCHFWGQGARWSENCVGLDACTKADMLLGVGSELPQKI